MRLGEMKRSAQGREPAGPQARAGALCHTLSCWGGNRKLCHHSDNSLVILEDAAFLETNKWVYDREISKTQNP